MTAQQFLDKYNGQSLSYDGLEVNRGQWGDKHGMSHKPIYSTWHGMIQRTTNPNHKRYKDYGHLGIDPRWKVFSNFYKDMGNKPEGMTLDRIDNNKGYFKENCRWATPSDQMHHQKLRKSKIPYKGVWINKNPFKKYVAEIKYNYKKISLGSYNTPEEAALAYDAAAIQLRGVNADTNILEVAR
jgi:hypothetical protein